MINPYVDSEIGQLKSVLLHRPDEALTHLSSQNYTDYLFDDVLWLNKAQEEHDVFANILIKEGVKVLYFSDLLCESLMIPDARLWVIDRVITKEKFGSENVEPLKEFLMSQDSALLAHWLTSGLSVANLTFKLKSFVGVYLKPTDFILPPLPNLIFMRDSSSWLGSSTSINSFNFKVRHFESIYIAAIYLFHPQLTKKNLFFLYKGYKPGTPTLEGGDIIILGPNHILIGLSQRTSATAVESIAKNILLRNPICVISVVEMPKSRSTMHLDTVFSMIDKNTFCYFTLALTHARSWNITSLPESNCLIIKPINNFIHYLAECYGVSETQFIKINNTLANEQWSDGSNLLTISPGKIISYDRNVNTNKRLTKAGIEVITMPSSELSRGRGGPHCMSCPIERVPLNEKDLVI